MTQSGGHIDVESELGRGSTVSVLLPMVEEESSKPAARDGGRGVPPGQETVLLAEDEPLVRHVAVQVLRRLGYDVLEASSGAHALRIAEERRDVAIDLLVTDVVMPIMGGRELAKCFVELHPESAVLYTSGYTDDAILRHGVHEQATHFLPKPFTPSELATKVREALDKS